MEISIITSKAFRCIQIINSIKFAQFILSRIADIQTLIAAGIDFRFFCYGMFTKYEGVSNCKEAILFYLQFQDQPQTMTPTIHL